MLINFSNNFFFFPAWFSPCSQYDLVLRTARIQGGFFHRPLFAGERPYKCHLPDCGRAFIQLSNLQQHLRNHDAQVERAKNRPFHCNICGKGFATESSLRTHTSKVSHVCNHTSFFLLSFCELFVCLFRYFPAFWLFSILDSLDLNRMSTYTCYLLFFIFTFTFIWFSHFITYLNVVLHFSHSLRRF